MDNLLKLWGKAGYEKIWRGLKLVSPEMSILWKYLEGNQELPKGNKGQFLNTYKNTFLTTGVQNSETVGCINPEISKILFND